MGAINENQAATEFARRRLVANLGNIGGRTAYLLYCDRYGAMNKRICYVNPAAIHEFDDSMSDSDFRLANMDAVQNINNPYSGEDRFSHIFWAGMYNDCLYVQECEVDKDYYIDYRNNRIGKSSNGYRFFSPAKDVETRQDYSNMRVIVMDSEYPENSTFLKHKTTFFDGTGRYLGRIENAFFGSSFGQYAWCSNLTQYFFADLCTGKICSPIYNNASSDYKFYRKKDTGDIIARIGVSEKYHNHLLTPEGMIPLTGYADEAIGDKESPRRGSGLRIITPIMGGYYVGSIYVEHYELDQSKWK